MRYLTLIPAAFFVVGILLAHGSSMKEPSAPTPVPAAQGSPDASGTPSWATPDSEDTREARVDSGSGTGGDGGVPLATASPTSTTPEADEVADSNLPQPTVNVTAALVTEPASKENGRPLYQSNEEQVRAAVQALFPPSEWATAMRVSACESGYRPDAVEPSGDHIGTFQVDPDLWGAVPLDIQGQVAQAVVVWQTQGWGAWACY